MVMKCLPNIGEISDHGEGLRCGVFPAILINNNVALFSDSSPAVPKGTQEGKAPVIWQPSDCNHPLLWALRNSVCSILAPESWDAYVKNNFTEPKLLHLPMHRKVLNSLTWDLWFSLINSNILVFWLPGLCCKTPLYLSSSSAQSLRAIWEAAS